MTCFSALQAASFSPRRNPPPRPVPAAPAVRLLSCCLLLEEALIAPTLLAAVSGFFFWELLVVVAGAAADCLCVLSSSRATGFIFTGGAAFFEAAVPRLLQCLDICPGLLHLKHLVLGSDDLFLNRMLVLPSSTLAAPLVAYYSNLLV